ncbi:methylmalonyl Co-A mutase-associated GTPase MeaB [Tautonia sociabilis]|uniref:Methylmalonyl Co-A mutase-associated GTPase MeaB n=1 Tax=Tautonia sociabilis TaxID=2080755 RepID=A0A432MJA6_9BACT|nr:methylmalonyl Co-A mutase-associated GTPase MeaB [Tautonia sociabilis]RUL87297.1 methylmalonyl Co-A mutase-associated GTPase MeaB [Tautonia sociabilis]
MPNRPGSPTPPPPRRRLGVEQYVEGVLARDRGVLARVITLIESRRPDDRETARRVLDALVPHSGRSIRLGITGVPGAGKSTLIEAMGMNLLDAGRRVAVLAIDPSSRLTGGSILGDKTRMPRLSTRDDAYIRPSPTGSTLGGVAGHTREAMIACEAAGFDVVIVETVGVGQSETTVADMVDTFLAVLIAGAGDELQGIKRGLVEMVDLLAINKADGENRRPVERAVAQYRNAIRLLHPPESPWIPPVLPCSAREGSGLDALWEQVLAHRQALERAGLLSEKRRSQAVRWMWDLVDDSVRRMLREGPGLRDLAEGLEARVRDGELTASTAADRLLSALGLSADRSAVPAFPPS